MTPGRCTWPFEACSTREDPGTVASLEAVVFLGKQPLQRCLDILRDARMLVFPSPAYETFGLALLDAMALGKPMVVSNRGTACEMVEDDRTGLHFKAGSAPDLAAVVRRLWDDAPLRERLGSAARMKFEVQFDEALTMARSE